MMNKMSNLSAIVCFERLNNQLLNLITGFLNQQDLQTLVLALSTSCNCERLNKMVRGKLIFIKYINSLEKSYYFSVFENQRYLQIQNDTVATLIMSNFNKFQEYPDKISKILKSSLKCLPQELRQESFEKLNDITVDPGISLPKLQRQSIGICINSPLQSFLYSKSQLSPTNAFGQDVYQNLKDHLQENDEKDFVSLMKSNHEISKKIRHYPHEITSNNMEEFMLKNNCLVNLVVGLFALLDAKVSMAQEYLNNLDDDFQVLVELLTRYSEFQSFVLLVEENLQFVFQNFNEMYEEIFGKANQEFSFWRPALVKWVTKMEKFHNFTNPIFCSIISQKMENCTLRKICENNKDTLQAFVYKYKSETNEHKQKFYELFIEDEYDMDRLFANYQEYMVDLSINERSVNWCGHTDQDLGISYLCLEECLMKQEKQILKGLEEDNEDAREYFKAKSEIYAESLKSRTSERIIKEIGKHLTEVEKSLNQLYKTNQKIEQFNKNRYQNQRMLKESAVTANSQSSSIVSDESIDYLEYDSEDEKVIG